MKNLPNRSKLLIVTSSFLSGEPTAIVTQRKVVFYKGALYVFAIRVLYSTEALKKMKSL